MSVNLPKEAVTRLVEPIDIKAHVFWVTELVINHPHVCKEVLRIAREIQSDMVRITTNVVGLVHIETVSWIGHDIKEPVSVGARRVHNVNN